MNGHGVPVFAGYSSQYGHGLGNLLAGVARRAVPMAIPLLRKAGSKLLDFGLHKLYNITQGGAPRRAPAKRRRTTRPAPPPPPRRRKTTSTAIKKRTVRRKAPVNKRARTKKDILS